MIERTIAVTPVVSNAVAYAAGDCVGSTLTFANACLGNGPWEIKSVRITDKSKQAVAYNFQPFKNLPAATYTDNSAYAPSAADMAKFCATIQLAASDCFLASANSHSTVSSLFSSVESDLSSGDVYGQLYIPSDVGSTVPTYTSTDSLIVYVTFISVR